jgi:hypothetical protein
MTPTDVKDYFVSVKGTTVRFRYMALPDIVAKEEVVVARTLGRNEGAFSSSYAELRW